MAKANYDDFATTIIELVGGKENVNSVAHCITRVRFKLKDESKANTEALEATEGVIKIMQANGQYQVVVGNNKVEDVYDAVLKIGGFAGGGSVDEDEDEGPKTLGARAIDLISGIFSPMLGTFAAAGIMKGLLALITQFFPAFANDGAYTVLYTVADGMFYFLPVVLAYTAAKKFKMNEFTGIAIGLALVYPTMVALTGGEIVGSIDIPLLGTFSWYSTFLGLPLIMPASGYTSSVIPVILMVWFGSMVEHWSKKWMPASVKMFFIPLLTMTLAVCLGYLVIGPVATAITNILATIFQLLFNLPVVGSIVGSLVVSAFWMCLVIFGFHWSLIPICLVNLQQLGYDYALCSQIGHSFALGAVLIAMYIKNKDANFRGIALPAAISAFFFGITEPAIYGVALPNKKAFVIACIGSAAGGLVIGLTGSVIFMSGGLGVFNWLSYIDINNVLGAGSTYMIWAIVASAVSAVVGFVLEFVTYNPEKEHA
ncbi:MAG TPA: PTS transporter subunit EIIC [Candidatus Coprousia avicola]|nr:PTS transporter subunit EIIC [Candidatus Coprousia avicola]